MGTLAVAGVLVLVLLVTGIGQAIWRQGGQLGAHCRDLMLAAQFQSGLDVCERIGRTVVGWQRSLERMVGESPAGDVMNLEEYAGQLARQFSASTTGFDAPAVSSLIDPGKWQRSRQEYANLLLSERVGIAMTNGAHGANLMEAGDTLRGMQFLQSSASMGEYGVLSQLQLGSLFAQGTAGVEADAGLARAYFAHALQSIRALQGAGTPEAGKVLQALPAPPDEMEAQLQQVVGQ